MIKIIAIIESFFNKKIKSNENQQFLKNLNFNYTIHYLKIIF